EGDRNSVTGTSMNMVLRPGEALTWRWGRADPVKYHGEHKPRYPEMSCNGLWEYRPEFCGDLWKNGAAAVHGAPAGGGGREGARGVVARTHAVPAGGGARGGGREGRQVLDGGGGEVRGGGGAAPGQFLPAGRPRTLRVRPPLRAGHGRPPQAVGHRQR